MKNYTVPFKNDVGFYSLQEFVSELEEELKSQGANNFEISVSTKSRNGDSYGEINVELHDNIDINVPESIQELRSEYMLK